MSTTNRRYASDDLWSRGSKAKAKTTAGKANGSVSTAGKNGGAKTQTVAVKAASHAPVPAQTGSLTPTAINRNDQRQTSASQKQQLQSIAAPSKSSGTAVDSMWNRGSSTPQHPTVSAADQMWQRGSTAQTSAKTAAEAYKEGQLKNFLRTYSEQGQRQRSQITASDAMERRGSAAAPEDRSAAMADAIAWQIDDSRRRQEAGSQLLGKTENADRYVAGILAIEREREQSLIQAYQKQLQNYQALRAQQQEKINQELETLKLQRKTARDVAASANHMLSGSGTADARDAWGQTLQEAEGEKDRLDKRIAYKTDRLTQLERNDEAGRLLERPFARKDPLAHYRNDPAFQDAARIYENLSEDTRARLDGLLELEEAQKSGVYDPSVMFPGEGFPPNAETSIDRRLGELGFALSLETDMSPFEREQLKELARRLARQRTMDGTRDAARQEPVLGTILGLTAFPVEAVTGGLGLADQALDWANNQFKPEAVRAEPDPNAGFMGITAAKNSLYSGVEDAIREGYGEGWAAAYRVGLEALETGLAYMAGGLPLETVSDGSGIYHDMRQRGVSQGNALTGGFGSIAVSALVQGLSSMNRWNGSTPQGGGSTWQSRMGNNLSIAMGQQAIDQAAAGANSRYNIRIKEYREQGYPENEAIAHAQSDIWNELFLIAAAASSI